MKNLTYIAIGIATLLTISCTKKFDQLNTNPAQLQTPDLEPVMTQVFKTTADRMGTEAMTYFWDYQQIINAFQYDRYSTNDNALWSDFYITGLGNLRQLKNIYGARPGFKNRIAIIDIWECYLYSYLIGTYGPVPYSKAGIADTHVPYDDENAIYTDILNRLTADYQAFDVTSATDKLATDIIFGGDLTKWKKFANFMRLKLAIRCQRNLPALAVSTIKDAMAHEADLPSSEADDAKVQYGTADGSQSPYYQRYLKAVTANTNYPVMSDFAFTYFRSYNDPRMKAYFNSSAAGYSITDTLTSTEDNFHHIVTYKIPYLGAPKATILLPQWNITAVYLQGASQTDSYSSLPGVNGKVPTTYSGVNVVAADRPFYFMTYSDVCFLEAEAAQLGYGGSQTADKYYYNGITANLTLWGVPAAQITAYEATAGIQWNTAGKGFNYALGLVNANIPNDPLTKIWTQEWLSAYPDGGFETWCLFRRTQFIAIPPNTNSVTPNINNTWSGLPDRWQYPASEIASNPLGVADGVNLLGSQDYPQTLLKFAKPYTPVNWAAARAFLDYTDMEKWYGLTIQSLTAAGVAYTEISKY